VVQKSFITLIPILKKKILGMNGNTNAHVNGPINLSHLDKILQKRKNAKSQKRKNAKTQNRSRKTLKILI